MLIGLISGSGTYQWPDLKDARPEACSTRSGNVELTSGRIGETEVVHLARHGSGHQRLSNHIDHVAHISAMVAMGVDAILSFTVCGAVDVRTPLGSLVVFDDLYFPSNRLPDGRPCTLHDTPGGRGRGHWIFDRPFSEPLRRALVHAAGTLDAAVVPRGCYGHVDGPRFNTRSEIAALSSIGVTAVSQTAGPEVVLAGEAGLPLALVGFVTDYANGVGNEPEPVSKIVARVEQSTGILALLANATLPVIPSADLAPVGSFYRFDSPDPSSDSGGPNGKRGPGQLGAQN